MAWAKRGGERFETYRPSRLTTRPEDRVPASEDQRQEAQGLFQRLKEFHEGDKIIKVISETTADTPIELIADWLYGKREIGPNVANLILRQLRRYNKRPNELLK